MDEKPYDGTVALISDPIWAQRDAVCCWRTSVHAVFTELGPDVHERPWSPPEPEASGSGSESLTPAARPPSVPRALLRFFRRVGWAIGYGVFRLFRRLLRPVVRPIAGIVRRRRAARDTGDQERVPATRPDPEPIDPRLASLAGSRLVIAETPAAARALVNSGVPRGAVWLLAVPPERSAAGEPAGWAADLRGVVPLIGGLIADSLDAAGILERVAGPVRTVVLPPIAADRPCPTCGSTGSIGTDTDYFPDDVPGHLLLWRTLLAQDPPSPTPYSYAVARLRGEAGPWLPPARDPWLPGGPEPEHEAGASPVPFTAEAQHAGARELLDATASPGETASGSDAPLKVRVFGTDLKFMRTLADRLEERPELDVAVDEWRKAGAKNDGITENLARAGQVLVAEWARPNAIWLSQTKRPDQRLIVRLHRFEIDSQYPKDIEIENVDSVVYIAPNMGRRIADELGWPGEKLVYIPNYVDLASLDRPKYADARFTLGLLGAVPGLKRFDLALDLLAAVRETDPRFSLLVRTQMGWAHKPSWEDPAERRELQRSLERVEKDPLLRGAVAFDSFGADVAAWFRKVGHVLSLSDVEGSHAALSEGMASGAVPVLRGWEGAAEAYGADWINASLANAAELVLEDASPEAWSARSDRAKADVNARFDHRAVVEAWVDLLEGRVDEARAHFSRWL